MNSKRESQQFNTQSPSHDIDNGGKVIFPFGPPIYQNYIRDDLRDALLEEGHRVRSNDNDYRDQLAGNMYFGGSYLYGNEFVKKVEGVLFDYLNSWFIFMRDYYSYKRVKFVTDASEFKVELPVMWINFQKRYDYNPMHHHGGIVSFVAFLKVPKEIFKIQAKSNMKHAGQLSFQYGEIISPLSATGWSVIPSDNLLFMFPSALNHSVPPFWVDEERISVSGNFHVKGNNSSMSGI